MHLVSLELTCSGLTLGSTLMIFTLSIHLSFFSNHFLITARAQSEVKPSADVGMGGGSQLILTGVRLAYGTWWMLLLLLKQIKWSKQWLKHINWSLCHISVTIHCTADTWHTMLCVTVLQFTSPMPGLYLDSCSLSVVSVVTGPAMPRPGFPLAPCLQADLRLPAAGQRVSDSWNELRRWYLISSKSTESLLLAF